MHRRWRAAWPRRSGWFDPPWPQGPQTTWRPDPISPAGWRPRWPVYRLRRGKYFEPVWEPPEWIKGYGAVTVATGSTGGVRVERHATGAAAPTKAVTGGVLVE